MLKLIIMKNDILLLNMEVDKIIDSKKYKNQRKYQVKWKDNSITWEGKRKKGMKEAINRYEKILTGKIDEFPAFFKKRSKNVRVIMVDEELYPEING